nr:conserved hypothetical protein [uncultured bacterium]
MKNINFLKLIAPIILLGLLASCSDDNDPTPVVPVAPTTYTFEREIDGAMVNTVSYGGQTTRLMQADELYSALNDASSSETALDLMFGGDGSASAGFANELLNGTSKIIRSKTSAYTSTATNLAIFDGWLAEFANDVAPNLGGTASAGVAGNLDGYQLNADGQEIDQLFFKSLIGAFALDQIINNYITPNQLDTGTRPADNTAGILEEGDPYTTMEHKWDEGFGYLYGQVADVESNFGLPAEGESTGNLLMKYFIKVNDPGQGGDIAQDSQIAETVYNAFIAGRHAITVADYDARDAAATTIKTELSKVIGMYAIYYLNDYLAKAGSGQTAKAHHSLSEAYGFIFSLQFTNDGGDTPYMSNTEVNIKLNDFSDFHNIQDSDVNSLIDEISALFGFES